MVSKSDSCSGLPTAMQFLRLCVSLFATYTSSLGPHTYGWYSVAMVSMGAAGGTWSAHSSAVVGEKVPLARSANGGQSGGTTGAVARATSIVPAPTAVAHTCSLDLQLTLKGILAHGVESLRTAAQNVPQMQ